MKICIVAALLVAAPACGAADVRKVVGNDGKVIYTNVSARSGGSARATDVLPPEVIGAVSNVLGVSHLLMRSRDMCGAAMPAAVKKYAASTHSWDVRNAAVILQKNRLMAHGDQRLVADALSGDAARRTDDMLRSVMNGSASEKAAWCNKAFADIDRGALDLAGRASIAPLMRANP